MVRLVGPVVKPFGTTVKKEVRKKVERWEKIWTRVYRGYVLPVEFGRGGYCTTMA